MVGGYIQPYFSIFSNRMKMRENNNEQINEYNRNENNKEFWINDIPIEYKPIGHDLIDGSCYW